MIKKLPTPVEVILFIVFSAIVMALMVSLPGCTATKEVTRTETIYDSTAISEKDSIISVREERIARLENEIKESLHSGVIFRNDTEDNPANPCPENKVEIKPDGSISATGNIKSAMLSKEKAERNYNELKHSYDSLAAVKQKEITTVEWREKTVEKQIKRGWQWWLFWVGVIVGCVGWNYLGSKIKLFIKKLRS